MLVLSIYDLLKIHIVDVVQVHAVFYFELYGLSHDEVECDAQAYWMPRLIHEELDPELARVWPPFLSDDVVRVLFRLNLRSQLLFRHWNEI